MPNHYVLHQFSEADRERALKDIQSLQLSRYDNPFERKSFLEDKTQILDSSPLLWMVDELRAYDMLRLVRRLTNLPIERADWRHYGGLFVYKHGDYLEPHVDAGVHPQTQERKVATAILYLTDASLMFWSGDPTTQDDPEVWLPTTIPVRAGEAILFTNHDMAWHSVPIVQSEEPRVCLTVSYMAHSNFSHTRYQNKRTRAYFARRVGQQEPPWLTELRKQRASEEHHAAVYRMEQ